MLIFTITLLLFTANPELELLTEFWGKDEDDLFGKWVEGGTDLNADGFPDIAIGAPGFGSYVNVYLGDPVMDTFVDFCLAPYTSCYFGGCIYSQASINGDEYPDLIIGYSNGSSSGSGVYIYFGGPDFDDIYDVYLPPPGPYWKNHFFGCDIATVDFNCDGNLDLIIGDYGYYADYPRKDRVGRVYCYYGPLTSTKPPDLIFEAPEHGIGHQYFGRGIGVPGDFDEDGYDDLVIGAPKYGGYSEGKIYIYSSGGGTTPVDEKFLGTGIIASLGNSIANQTDFNGDGCGDIVTGAYRWWEYRGLVCIAFNPWTSGFDTYLDGELTKNICLGYSIDNIGDINGDGVDDILVGAPGLTYEYDNPKPNASYIWYGSYPFEENFDHKFVPESIGYNFGRSVSIAGDLNLDGIPEIIIGADYAKINNVRKGKAYLYGKVVLRSSDDEATAYNNGKKFERMPNTDDLHIVYQSGGNVVYSYSINGGQKWSPPQAIFKGRYPAIDLSEDGSRLGLAWVRGLSLDTLFFSELVNGTWTTPEICYIATAIGPPSITYHSDGRIFIAFSEATGAEQGYFAICVYFTPGQSKSVQILDQSTVSIGPPSIDFLPFNSTINVAWERNDRVYFRYYDGDWNQPIEEVTGASDKFGRQVSIEADGDKVYVVWSGQSKFATHDEIYWRYRNYSLIPPWSGIYRVSIGSATNCYYPTLSGGYDCSYSENGEIYFNDFDPVEGNWRTPNNISQTPNRSIFSHINLQGGCVRLIWTENDGIPYDIRYHWFMKEIDASLNYFADLGNSKPHPITLSRDGYRSYGAKPYLHHDCGKDKLRYKLDHLDPHLIYTLELINYTKESNAKLNLKIDGKILGDVMITPDRLIRSLFRIPAELYADSSLTVEINRSSGKEASASLLLLYAREQRGGGGPQEGSASPSIPERTGLSDVYPSLIRKSFTIDYSLDHPVEVTIIISMRPEER